MELKEPAQRVQKDLNGGEKQLKYNNQYKQMDFENQHQQSGNEPNDEPSPAEQNNDSSKSKKKFNIELTVSQANAIMKILPISYTLQVDRESKNKRQNNKKKSNVKKEVLPEPLEPMSERSKKANNSIKYSEDVNALANYSRANSQIYYEDMEDTMKPCLKILQMLKSSKTSWPFKDPVDPIAQGVPNYLEIIKEPMDLSTIQINLKNGFYNSSTQFHADINKIIKNSYMFNKNNPEFCKLTAEFEQYYQKISADPVIRNETVSFTNRSAFQNKTKKPKPLPKNQHKYREPSESQPVTLAEKKALALELKRFPKEYLKGVAEIVYEGQPPQSEQLNIQNLPTNKIRQLQRYVQSKLSLIEQKNQQNRGMQQEEERSEESSFESDSDS